jgi:Ca-activated chloride channel family protein
MGPEEYNALRLSFDATPEEIRQAYFDAAKLLHPDVNNNQKDNEKFLEIKKAYEVLIDPAKREKNDQFIAQDEKIFKPLIINTKFSCSNIPRLDEPQLIYSLVEIESNPDIENNTVPPVLITLVVDKSTSMRGERLDDLKNNLQQFIDLLKENELIAVIAFSDKAEELFFPKNREELEAVRSKIESLSASGSTEIFQGLSAAVSLLRKYSNQNMIRYLLLLTDGHTYGDEEKCELLIKEACSEGINFNAVGIGNDWNDRFLDRLSAIGGGETLFVSTAKEMYNSVKNIINNANVLSARSVTFDFLLDPAVKLTYAFRIKPNLSVLPVESPINLGNLYFGKKLSILLEYQVQPIDHHVNECRLSFGTIKAEIPSRSVKQARLFIDNKKQIVDEYQKEHIPTSIVDAMATLTLYRLQDKARTNLEEGNYTQATRYLQNLATHLLAIGDRELAHTVLMEAESIQSENRYSEDGEKKIKYGTRRLLMLPEPER